MGVIGAETGEVTGAAVVLIAAVATAKRVRSLMVSRAVRPLLRLVRSARIAAPVVGVTGIAALGAVAVASAAGVASASRRGPWWS